VPLLDLSDRGDRLFLGFLASMLVVTAILAWQAVESQEVKSALRGGFEQPVELDPLEGGTVGAGAGYLNAGDRTLTLEGAELIEPENVELIDVAVSEASGAVELEGFELAPGQEADLVARVQVKEPGGPAGFEGLRVHYRAGGRAGQAP
jgi:hypothetical protein